MDMLKLLAALGWRNLWRNKRRTFITFTSIGVGVWSMISLAALMDAWAMSTFNASINTLIGHGQIHAKAYLDDPSVDHRMVSPSETMRAILNEPVVKAWASRVRVSAIVLSERESAPVTLVGINPKQEQGLSFISTAVVSGHNLAGNNAPGILLGRKLVKRLRTGLNKRVVLMSQDSAGVIAERGVRVVGIFEAENSETETLYAFIAIKPAQKMLRISNEISEISFVLHNQELLPQTLKRLRDNAPDLAVASWSELEPFTQAILDMSTGTIALWTVIMFILVAFGLINTLLMAVFERTREFGLFQALGMRPKWILIQVLIESMLLVGVGVVVGLVTGVMTIEVFKNGLDLGGLAEGAITFGAGRILYPQMDWAQGLYITMFVWVMGVVISLYPAWHAARDVPVNTINRSY